MNREISYFSLDYLNRLTDEDLHPNHMENLARVMEEYDPEGKRAHELAKKYRKQIN